MSVDLSEPDEAQVIALLQPFVDGELSDEEHELVAAQIAANPEYQAIVGEQRRVRTALRGLERELAPPELRERILADLDAVDAGRRVAEQRGWSAPVVGRIRAFGRGAALMVPAAAAAVVLFVVASDAGWLAGSPAGGAHVDGSVASSFELRPRRGADVQPPSRAELAPAEAESPAEPPAAVGPDPSLPGAEELADNLGFAVQVAPPRSLPSDVALVSDSERSPGSSAMVRYRDGAGAVIVDRQRRAGIAALRGQQHAHQGYDYYLSRDEWGRPQIEFEIGRVHHSLAREGGDARADSPVSAEEPDFRGLLVVARALRQAHAR